MSLISGCHFPSRKGCSLSKCSPFWRWKFLSCELEGTMYILMLWTSFIHIMRAHAHIASTWMMSNTFGSPLLFVLAFSPLQNKYCVLALKFNIIIQMTEMIKSMTRNVTWLHIHHETLSRFSLLIPTHQLNKLRPS